LAPSGIGRPRRPRPLTQEQDKRVEEHRVPGASDPPAAAFPVDSHLAGNGPHEEIVDHPGGFACPILHQALLQRWLAAQVAEEEAAAQDGHPNGDPGPDTPEPGQRGKTRAGKGDIDSRVDLTSAMALLRGLTREPTIEKIGESDARI